MVGRGGAECQGEGGTHRHVPRRDSGASKFPAGREAEKNCIIHRRAAETPREGPLLSYLSAFAIRESNSSHHPLPWEQCSAPKLDHPNKLSAPATDGELVPDPQSS
jgi:hypothetical protein